MKLSTQIAAIITFCLTFGSKPVAANFRRCVDDVDENMDYFPHKISPEFSKKWEITYQNTYKIITNLQAGTSYLLYQCGTTPPAEEADKHDMTISVPLQDGLVLDSTTQVPHLQQLGLRRQIKAWLGDTTWISSPCIQTMVAEDAIERLFAENITDTYLVENPAAVVLSGSSSSSTSNAFIISERDEDGSLDIYEWHKVYASLFNLEETANKQFEEAKERFQCSAHNAEFIFNQREVGKDKPKVVWARYSDWKEPTYWDVSNSCDDDNNYYCELADLCAADLLDSNDSGSISYYGDKHMTNEEFFEFAKDADHWIYSGFNWATTYTKFKEDLASFKSVQNDEVYDVLLSGSGMWFEDRLAEFDIVLQDFCEVVGHYDDTESEQHTRRYFRRVLGDNKEDIPATEECEPGFVDIPWESRASQCVRLEDMESSATSLISTIGLVVSIVCSTISLFML